MIEREYGLEPIALGQVHDRRVRQLRLLIFELLEETSQFFHGICIKRRQHKYPSAQHPKQRLDRVWIVSERICDFRDYRPEGDEWRPQTLQKLDTYSMILVPRSQNGNQGT